MATPHLESPAPSAGALKRVHDMLDKDCAKLAPSTKRIKTLVHDKERAPLIVKALSLGKARLASTPYAYDIRVAWETWKSYAESLPPKIYLEGLKRKRIFSKSKYNREVRRSVCHGLLEKITAREIRDQIYGYLVVPSTVRLIGILDHDHLHYNDYGQGCTYVGQRGKACLSIQNRERWTFDLQCSRLDLSDIWLCERVGHKFLVELVEHWYRVNTFAIWEPDDLSLVADLATQDRWQLGIVPRDYIRNVRFNMSMAFVARDRHGVPPWQLPLLRHRLEQLLQFKRGTRIKLGILSCKTTRSRSRRSAFSHGIMEVALWARDKRILWERDVTEKLEFVKDLESGLFNTFKKLCAAGLRLVFKVDDGLEISVNDEEEIAYDLWVEKILAYQPTRRQRHYFDWRIQTD
ncbi:hypothetical protein J4E89_010343 [Alternaria sp. Ai002NY15]|nr:hypothetical protein J4E89_010343 [Alternaria sp. Ai002NY15]